MKHSPKSPSKQSKQLALLELQEDDARRQESLAKMEEWLVSQPHITCRADSSFLLRFLRFRKYRVEEAQENLVKYIKMRTENPRWFNSLDIREPGLADLIDGGYYFALPERDSQGRRVFFNRTAAVDTNRHNSADQMRAMLLCFESLIEDPENQLHGFTHILDEKDVGFSFLTTWNVGDATKAIQCCEKTLPVSHKEVNLVNLSPMFSAVYEFVKTLLSDKMAARMKVHASLESLHSVIDAKILPKEYGGNVPMATMIKQYRSEAEDVRDKVLSLDHLRVAKKQPDSSSKLTRTLSKMQKSFKKLDID